MIIAESEMRANELEPTRESREHRANADPVTSFGAQARLKVGATASATASGSVRSVFAEDFPRGSYFVHVRGRRKSHRTSETA